MTYGELHLLFTNKFKNYSVEACAAAMKDAYETLECFRDKSTDDPYYIKLWAEIDALRERQLKLSKRNSNNALEI